MLRLPTLACAALLLLGRALALEPAPAPIPLPEAAPLPATEGPAPLRPTPLQAPSEHPPHSLLIQPNGTFLEEWLDVPHAFLERRVFGVVDGFDRFFADEGDLTSTRARSFIRLRGETRAEDDGTLTPGVTVRADLALPHIQERLKRFRILIENAGRGTTDTQPRPLAGENREPADAVLRVSLFDSLRSAIDLGGGILIGLPPGVVGRARWRYSRELGKVALARVAATGFWNTRDGFGSNGSVALERALSSRLLLRWTNGTLVSQSSHGWESASELALLATLGRTTGLTLLGSATSNSKPELVVQQWRVAAKLRASILRRWIYWELEPEVVWPHEDTKGRRVIPAVIFRLELQFEEARTT